MLFTFLDRMVQYLPPSYMPKVCILHVSKHIPVRSIWTYRYDNIWYGSLYQRRREQKNTPAYATGLLVASISNHFKRTRFRTPHANASKTQRPTNHGKHNLLI